MKAGRAWGGSGVRQLKTFIRFVRQRAFAVLEKARLETAAAVFF